MKRTIPLPNMILYVIYENLVNQELSDPIKQDYIMKTLPTIDIKTIPDEYYTEKFIKCLLSFSVFSENVRLQLIETASRKFVERDNREGILYIRRYLSSDNIFYEIAIERQNRDLIHWLYENCRKNVSPLYFERVSIHTDTEIISHTI
jgi:hypothetical protein